MEFNLEVIYNRIWEFILDILAKAGVNFDASKLPAWLKVPGTEA